MKLPRVNWPSRPRPHPHGPLWARYSADAMALAEAADLDVAGLDEIARNAPPFAMTPGRGACNWYFQDLGETAVGGVMTALRIAARLQDAKGVHQRFIICSAGDAKAISARIQKAFPNLRGSEVLVLDSAEKLANIPPADIGVATLWTTAYVLARVTNCARKMYLIQDFEPLFYPAGSTAAQAELTYRFGFEAICNTEPLREIYFDRYAGEAIAFTPQLDQDVFYPGPLENRWPRARVFFYARPENPRNAFEISAAAIKRLKHRLGSSVEILCAGAEFDLARYGLDGVVEPLGWLAYAKTGDIYRTCHVGLAPMLTPHPSYLPMELMGCGALVVALHNGANEWLLQDGETCLCAEATASSLANQLFRAVTGWDDLAPIRLNAARGVARLAGRGWDAELAPVIEFMSRPAGAADVWTGAAAPRRRLLAPTARQVQRSATGRAG